LAVNAWRTGLAVTALAPGLVLLGIGSGLGVMVFLYLAWVIVAALTSGEFADNHGFIVELLAWLLYMTPYSLVSWGLARRLRQRSIALNWIAAGIWTTIYVVLVVFAFPVRNPF
jgi:hypothetical protein